MGAGPHIALVMLSIGGRERYLQAFLHSLSQQAYKNFSLWLGYLQNADDYQQLARRFAMLPINLLACPNLGLSHGRNLVLARVSAAQVVAFPDDDCSYTPQTLQEVAAFFNSQRPPAVLLARWAVPGESLGPAKAAYQEHSRFSFLEKSGSPFQFYSAATVRAVGAFNEKLGPGTALGAGEDIDFLLRAAARVPIYRCPQVVVRHPQVIGPSANLYAKGFGYGRSLGWLLRQYHYPAWFRLLSISQSLARMLAQPKLARFYWGHVLGQAASPPTV